GRRLTGAGPMNPRPREKHKIAPNSNPLVTDLSRGCRKAGQARMHAFASPLAAAAARPDTRGRDLPAVAAAAGLKGHGRLWPAAVISADRPSGSACSSGI